MNSLDITQEYTFGDTLGTGNFSKVILGTHKKTGEKFAIKVIEKKEVDGARLKTEVEIMKKVSHPNIISLKEVYDSDPTKLYLVMELVTGGELFNKIVGEFSYAQLMLPQAVHNNLGCRNRILLGKNSKGSGETNGFCC